MTERTLTITNPPDGFEAAAEFRAPKEGEYFFAESGAIFRASSDLLRSFIVLTPIKKKYKLQGHDYVNYHGARMPWWLAQKFPPSEAFELAEHTWYPMHSFGIVDVPEGVDLEFLDIDARGMPRLTNTRHGATLAWRVKGLKDGWTL